MRKLAISDIHGCNRTFHALLQTIALSKTDELYLLGDYIDRGPDSRGVLDTIWNLQSAGYTIHCLRGNHEEMLLEALESRSDAERFLINGGDTTLMSFGVGEPGAVPRKYLDWVAQLPYYFEVDNYLLVHAGFDFTHPDPLVGKQQMVWIRNWYRNIDRDWLADRYIVHGHTPANEVDICRQAHYLERDRVLDIDCGCVFKSFLQHSGPGGKGQLCAFDMTNFELFFEENREASG